MLEIVFRKIRPFTKSEDLRRRADSVVFALDGEATISSLSPKKLSFSEFDSDVHDPVRARGVLGLAAFSKEALQRELGVSEILEISSLDIDPLLLSPEEARALVDGSLSFDKPLFVSRAVVLTDQGKKVVEFERPGTFRFIGGTDEILHPLIKHLEHLGLWVDVEWERRMARRL